MNQLTTIQEVLSPSDDLQGPGTDLILSDVLTSQIVFGKPGYLPRLLKLVTDEVSAFEPDMSTAAGREEIRAFAFKIARSKTGLDALGKEWGEGHYRAWKESTNIRNHLTSYLGSLQDQVRKPLTEWENAEKARVDAHEVALAVLLSFAQFVGDPTCAEIGERIDKLDAIAPRDWEEYAARAEDALSEVREHLSAKFTETAQREADRAELEKLRQESLARAQKDRDDRIAADAAARARQEESVARERAEKAKHAAELKAKQAIADKKAAEVKAVQDRKDAAAKGKREKDAAVKAERERLLSIKADEEAAARLRENNLRHVKKINSAILEAMMDAAGITSGPATKLLAAIVAGKIPNVKVIY